MKRFLSLTVVAVMLLTTLMLSSCDFINQAKDYVHGIFGIETTRYTITEEEWNNLPVIDNMHLEMTVNYSGMYQSAICDITKEAAKVTMKVKQGSTTYEQSGYLDFVADYSVLEEAPGEWVGTKGAVFDLIDLSTMSEEIEYSKLVYNEDTKEYTYYDKEINMDATLRFENGSLVSMFVKTIDSEYEVVVKITNVGTTTVELPSYTKMN